MQIRTAEGWKALRRPSPELRAVPNPARHLAERMRGELSMLLTGGNADVVAAQMAQALYRRFGVT